MLAGSTATNTGPSVLNGDLGVSPGTALVGFGLPAVVNGATHATDAVAAQAQLDLTTAYDVAAGQPVSPANDLTGTDLGNRSSRPAPTASPRPPSSRGRSRWTPRATRHAQFVFEIASSLTTASASSVVLLNGASPCNVYWQVGSLGDARHHDGVPGQPDGAREHLAQQRRDRHRSPARAQRRGHADQQRARQQPLQHRLHADRTAARAPAPAPAPAPGRAPARRPGAAATAKALLDRTGEPGQQPEAHDDAQRHDQLRAHAARDLHLRVPRDRARQADQARRLHARRQADLESSASARTACSCGPCPARTASTRA